MAVDARSILNYQANDADHRTFAQAIHDQLVAVGLTQTSDTGQANLATITRPGTNAVSGYEIFRFNDTEQATLGCFLKIEYGTGNAATVPAVRYTVGNSTNGAGTLVNATSYSPLMAWLNTTDVAAQTRPAFASYAEGQFVHMFGQDLTNAGRGSFIYIGRPRVYDGTRTTDAIIVFYKASYDGTAFGSNQKRLQVLRAGGGGPAMSNSREIPAMATLEGQDDQVGANTALFPVAFAVNGNIRFSSLFVYRAAAIAADAQQSVTVFGGAKNFRTLGNLYTVTDISVAVPYL